MVRELLQISKEEIIGRRILVIDYVEIFNEGYISRSNTTKERGKIEKIKQRKR